MTSRWMTAPLGAALLVSAFAPAPPPLPTQNELAALSRTFDVPGAALAGLTACEVDEPIVTAGMADLAKGTPVTPDTAFEAASMSKPVFAWLVMALAEEGGIDLDRPFAEDFDYPRIKDREAYARLTPRLVLTHRTGLPNWADSATRFDERRAPIPFEAPPGTAFVYSGEGFELLQAYVQAKTGKPLPTLFEERLGEVMPNSTFVLPLPEGVTPSRGYARASEPETGRDLDTLSQRGVAAASLLTTAGDYAAFLSHVCKREGLTPESYEAMLTPQSPAPDEAMETSWALGFMTVRTPDGLMIGHGGNNGEYRAFGGFLEGSGHGLVVLTNGETGQAMIDAIIAPPAE